PSQAPHMVLDINPTGPSSPTGLAAIGATTYFAANDGAHGQELWQSDGTAAGTALVADINPGGAGSNPGNLTNVNGTLFFAADDGTNGAALWQGDGAGAGAPHLKDSYPAAYYPTRDYSTPYGPPSSSPSNLTNVNGTLFFTADDGTHGSELWR